PRRSFCIALIVSTEYLGTLIVLFAQVQFDPDAFRRDTTQIETFASSHGTVSWVARRPRGGVTSPARRREILSAKLSMAPVRTYAAFVLTIDGGTGMSGQASPRQKQVSRPDGQVGT